MEQKNRVKWQPLVRAGEKWSTALATAGCHAHSQVHVERNINRHFYFHQFGEQI